jgi:hypothetical protein
MGGLTVNRKSATNCYVIFYTHTGKSLLEALILASTNPLYDKRLFIDLPVQYMKTTSSEHELCTLIVFLFLFCHSKQLMYTTCSELVVFMY